MQLTLWQVIEPLVQPMARLFRPRPPAPPPARPPAAPKVLPAREPRPARAKRPRVKPATAASATPIAPASAQAAYDRVTREMLAKYGIKCRQWRKAMSGLAWEMRSRATGEVVARYIKAPYPRGPMSAAVFLHEIGHHAIGFDTYKPRCLEEYHAWRWSLEAMDAHGLNITDAVRRRMHASLHYAIAKAQRRGLKQLPAELLPFVDRPPKRVAKPARRRALDA